MSERFNSAQTSQSSPSTPQLRSRIHLPSSKLVRKARESRYLGGGGGNGGGGNDFVLESLPRLSMNRSTTTVSEGDGDSIREQGYYKTHHPTSGLETQPYAKELPYFLSYATSSLDWDSWLTSALEGCVAFSSANYRIDSNGNSISRSPPRKVLDIGCGAGHWILNQAFTSGWEETQFVGLDAEPSRFSEDLLPPSLAGRISHVQHDLSKGSLPFLDNQFDFVRIARMNFAIPEIKWMDLLEECIRVLSPGSYIEIVELDLSLYRGNDQVQKILDSVLDHQFINSRPLTVIPSNLTLAARDLRSTGRIATRLPSAPIPPHQIPLESEPTFSANLPSLGKFSAGSDPTLVTPSTTFTSHVALHGYAQWLASSSFGIAHAALEARESEDRGFHGEQGEGVVYLGKKEKDMSDMIDAVETYADDLRERAGLAQIITSRFGWEPTFDQKLQQQLTDNLPVLEDRLRIFGRERRKRDSLFGGQSDPEIEFRYQQNELAMRECQNELKLVRRRLEGREKREKGDEEDLGSMDFEVFVARAP
ncbi:hypothetical protein JCM3765_002673 [Sporobolomyces pararoseus]